MVSFNLIKCSTHATDPKHTEVDYKLTICEVVGLCIKTIIKKDKIRKALKINMTVEGMTFSYHPKNRKIMI